MNTFVKKHPIKAIIALTPFTLAAQIFIDWLLGDRSEILNLWKLIGAWQEFVAGGEWWKIQFMLGQEEVGGLALALATETALLIQLLWAGIIVWNWRRFVK